MTDTSAAASATAREAAKILLETKSVLCNAREPFTYTSGKTGPVYVDCRRLISFPEARAKLMDMGAAILRDKIGLGAFDALAGGETAGIPYAAFLAERTGKPMLYVRKKPKGFGRMAQIEGFFEDGSAPRVVLVEDVQNYGSSTHVFIDALRAAGARVDHFFVLFRYGNRPDVDKTMTDMGLAVHALCTWKDVIAAAREIGYFDAATLESVESYLANPDGWSAGAARKG